MKQKIMTSLLLGLSISMILFACNQQTKTDETAKTDTTKTEMVPMPGFDASMDATGMAGYPASILADTLNVKAYEFVANPGDSIPMHSHPDHVIYVLETGTAAITAKDGTVQTVEFKKGSCMIGGPQAHAAKNTGTTALKLLIVHIYRPRS